jgi:uncharacterized membrane protein YkvA (DUF1232 family)
VRWRDLPRLVPPVAGLLCGLARDGRVPVRAKVALGAAAALLISPIDPIPDWIPVLGHLDDLLLLALVFDLLVNDLPGDVVASHWRGTPDELAWLRCASTRVARFIPAPRRLTRRLLGVAGLAGPAG